MRAMATIYATTILANSGLNIKTIPKIIIPIDVQRRLLLNSGRLVEVPIDWNKRTIPKINSQKPITVGMRIGKVKK